MVLLSDCFFVFVLAMAAIIPGLSSDGYGLNY
jgi:hypothetical protein